MKRYLSTLCLLLAIGVGVQADQSVPDDFAYGMTVKTKGRASLWQVELPEAVYQSVIRSDLGDIRVFDATGQLIPFILRRPEATILEPPAPMPLPIFPLYGSEEKQTTGHALRIVTDETGAIVETTREALPLEKQQIVSAYLLDATKMSHNAEKLILEWETVGEEGFTAGINIDVSADLAAWYGLVHRATVADLKFGGHQLIHNEIDVPVGRYKYMRIRWPITLRNVKLKSVTVVFQSTEQPPQRRWLKVQGEKMPTTFDEYSFDAKGNWPIDQARITFPPENILINVALSSRPSTAAVWARRYQGPVYKLYKENNATLTSPPASFAVTTDRYWHLEEFGTSRVLSRYTPVLELGWLPHILTFVAQGKPPYVIAYGSGVVGPLEQSRDPLLSAFAYKQKRILTKSATTSEAYLLGGLDKLNLPPPPLPWRTWLLWLVLVSGAMLLAWMVWRLSRQMGSTPKAPE